MYINPEHGFPEDMVYREKLLKVIWKTFDIKKSIRRIVKAYRRRRISKELETNPLRMFMLMRLKSFYEMGYKKYRWVTQKDERVRESHRRRDGKVYYISSAFKLKAPFPGDVRDKSGRIIPEEVYNCRCYIEPVR